MIWIAIALLTGLGAFAVLWPLARRSRDGGHVAASRLFYEAQLAELERDRERGVLDETEYAAVRAETARRLIAAQGRQEYLSVASTGSRRMAALVAIVLLPMVTVGLYALIGKPSFSDRPLQARLDAPPGKIELIAAVAKIEKHLARAPDDVRGWQIISTVYSRMGRHGEAARAWRNILRIAGPNAQRYGALGEALVFEAKGQVTADARKAFEAALKLDPKFGQALFFFGMAAEQDGDIARAKDFWTRLIAQTPKNSPGIAVIRERLAMLEAKENAGAKGPQSETGKAVAALPPDQQKAAIAGMVDSLAGRLETEPKDLPGWLMLMRAYTVLKKPDAARDALRKAKSVFAGDRAALDRLEAQRRELGLGE